MTDFTVKTGEGEAEKSVTVSYDIPENLAAMVHKYGEETVYNFANRAVTQAVQNIARVRLADGNETAAIQTAVSEWVPGVRGVVTRKSPFARAAAVLGALSAEELQALLAKVKAAEKAAKSAG